MPAGNRPPHDGRVPYFDHNATSPLLPEAQTAWRDAVERAWQNPASPHRAGARVGVRLKQAGDVIAALLGLAPERLSFPASATEAADAVLRHLAAKAEPAAMLAVNPTEHPAVRAAVDFHWRGPVQELAITRDGVVEPAALASALAAGASVAVVMAANHETGVIQPWAELNRVARAAGATLVCDATQWFGKLPAAGLGAVDWGFGSAHKFGGPKGAGLLWRAPEATDFSLRPNGAGTANYPSVAAMAVALQHGESREVWREAERVLVRERFERALLGAVPGSTVVGAGVDRLWNTVLVRLPHGDGPRWVTRLDRRGFEVASGAACATGRDTPSAGLRALGLSPDDAKRVVRVSAGPETTAAEWEELVEAFRTVAPEVVPAGNVITFG